MSKDGTECVCTICGRRYVYFRKGGFTLSKCNSCSVNRYKRGLKQKMVNYKGGKCFVCGYSRCTEALDFHHIDESTKAFNLSGGHCRRWSEIKLELDKCVLLCSNCHREIHAGLTAL